MQDMTLRARDRERHFSQTLLELSSKGIEGVIESIQVVYSTHEPLMVDFQRFNQLRIFKKINAEEADKPKIAKITYSTLAQNARFLEKAKGLPENDIKDEARALFRVHNLLVARAVDGDCWLVPS